MSVYQANIEVLCYECRSLDTPASSPNLNISKVTLQPGEEAAIGCSIDSLGNPEITWSWTCGTQRMRNRVQTRGLTSDIVITADPDLNEKICYCSVEVTYGQRFQANSNTALVSVICELHTIHDLHNY